MPRNTKNSQRAYMASSSSNPGRPFEGKNLGYAQGYRPGFTPYKRQYTRRGLYKNRRLPGAARSMPLINETKYVDGYLDTVAVHELSNSADDNWADTELNPRQVTAVYGCLPVPRQGTNYADRDGRKIFVKTIRIKGQIRWTSVADAAAPVTVTPVRIVIVKDTRTNGTELSGENVIGAGLGSDGQATLSGDGGALGLPTNPDGWGRYRIMFDQTFDPPSISAAGTTNIDQQGVYTTFDIVIRPKCYINFDDSTGAIGSIIDNSFHFLAAATAGGTDQQITYYARTSFVG